MSQELIIRVVILVIIHVVVMELFIWVARHSLWIIPSFLAAVVAGFMLLVWFTIPPVTANDMVNITGAFERYTINKDKWFVVYLRNDPREYSVTDTEYFNQTAFIETIQPGDTLTVSFLQRVLESDPSYVVLFELKSPSNVFLSADDILADRDYDRKVIEPIVFIVASLVTVATLFAFVVRHEALNVGLGILVGALVMYVLEFYFSVWREAAVVAMCFLPILYPAIWLFETRRRKRDKIEWILSGAIYILMIGFVFLGIISFGFTRT